MSAFISLQGGVRWTAWVWILIAVVVIVVLWLVWGRSQKRKSDQLQKQFGINPTVVANYRDALSTSKKAGSGDASTEEMRRAMQQYRSPFEELLERDSAADDLNRDDQIGRSRIARSSPAERT